MPASVKQKTGRKGQFSCNFCRSRKLRCDRPLPCTSCKSRGRTCQFEPSHTNSEPCQTAALTLAEIIPQQQERVATTPLPISTSTKPLAPTQHGLLTEVQALRKLAEDLERRVAQSTVNNESPIVVSDVSTTPDSQDVTPLSDTPLSNLSHFSEVVAHLQRVSRSQSSIDAIPDEDVVFRIEHIQTIPQAPTYNTQLGKPTSCIWIPHLSETKTLLEHYISNLSHIQHVIHPPSLRTAICNLYRKISAHERLEPGTVILLLSIIANATHVWVAGDTADGESSLFLSSTQAHAQTRMWVKAAQTVLNATQNDAGTLETIQGIILLSFVVCNVECVSMRYRSLISSGLLLGHELGLHRLDRDTNTTKDDLATEMGRRAWWYLVATDWLIAARFDGPTEGVYQAHPLQMTVNKPRNVNDIDFKDGYFFPPQPLHQPTDMSYFLQRIQLAEISRDMVDRSQMAIVKSGQSNYYEGVMTMDSKLEQMIHNVPDFFQLKNYELFAEYNRTSSIFLQAYMLNSLMHTQRCRMHLAYLTTGSRDDPAYASSREACLTSAKHIIYTETRLLESKHAFVQIRGRLAAILYGVFIAGIVLLMDVCLHRPQAVQDEAQRGELATALSIIQDMRNYSMAAASLHESLLQIVSRYGAQQPQKQVQSDTADMLSSRQQGGWTTLNAHENAIASATQSSSTFDQQMEEPASSIYFDQLHWDDLFTGLATSSFF
ncbi:hypothetical protein FB567DRAFT_550997 [Paraphoma chrysanthemicola]|uniref:Zn(2)-C6 fungal-type domain-containing protein n=1 Tax=Paraphoma chrysanthemicola TaxID=798071 RepID=A0A8K0R250_9PLEO|nr:hypothetical protein FB567DRAFT_550997 [Paraphoma chrysanthemicola]